MEYWESAGKNLYYIQNDIYPDFKRPIIPIFHYSSIPINIKHEILRLGTLL
jgi:hypothetical protein